jgi:hypothetical protein
MLVYKSTGYIKKFVEFYPLKNWAILIFIALFFLFGVVSQKYGLPGKFYRTVKGVVSINYLKSYFVSTDKLIIDIKHENIQKLRYLREKIKNSKSGLLFSQDDSDMWVSADVSINSSLLNYDAKIRLKGNSLTVRKNDQKWGLRIKLTGENTIFGMRRFSIHDPKVKSNLSEWLFYKFLNELGLINLRYDFIELLINGRSYGLHAIEEHFDKRLIENNKQRTGVIVRFNEYWQYYHHLRSEHNKKEHNEEYLAEVYSISSVGTY